jgi:hypothetical protein
VNVSLKAPARFLQQWSVPWERASLEGTLMLICYFRENDAFRQSLVQAFVGSDEIHHGGLLTKRTG